MSWFTPSGQQVTNEGTTASNPPNVDIQTEVGGTPMFKEVYDPNNDEMVTEAERVQGREAYELFDGLRLLGKDIQSSGLGDQKFLKFDAGSDSWVLSTATGSSNLADLNDVEDGTPSDNDIISYVNSQWSFTSGLSTPHFSNPMGNNVTFGLTDSDSQIRIQGGQDTDDKFVSFGHTNASSVYTEQVRMGVNGANTFTIEKSDGTALLGINNGIVETPKLRISNNSTQTAVQGALY